MPVERMLLPGCPLRVVPPPRHQHWVGVGRLVLPCCGGTANWYREAQIPQGTRYRWKTPDPPPRHPPWRNPGKGSRMGGQALGTPIARRVLGCSALVPRSGSCLRAVPGASRKEQPAATGATRISPETWRHMAQPCPGMGFGELPEQQGGTLRPWPREGSVGSGSSQAGAKPRLCPGKDTVAGTSWEGD